MDSRLLWGVVDLLILENLDHGPNYGYAITQRVLSQSDGYFELTEGSLYPALHRLERKKLLDARWQQTDEGRRRKYYRLTAAGRRTLQAKRQEWEAFTAGVNGVLRGGYDPA